jgi:hypothetical protein
MPLLSTTANLVVHDSLHPGTGLPAAGGSARRPTPGRACFTARGSSPARWQPTSRWPKRQTATSRTAGPFLQRYLPFWVANFVQRLALTLLPLVALLVPVFKFLPALLHWKERNRLFRRYGELKFLERDIDTAHAE